jgi:micrococcal nuclease
MMRAKLKLNKPLFFILAFILSGLAGYCFFADLDRVPAEEGGKIFYSVAEVIDGDTIKVKMGGKTETIRLIGIDTPEVASPYREEGCFGKEASEEMKKILQNKNIYLAADPTASDKDKYGRLLRYVYLPGGEFVNAKLVEEGYAFNYIYEPFQYMKQFGNLENQAKTARLGIWSEKCDY